ncbi:MAG: ribosomal RNA small subunit methyltransferase A [Acidobacteria bacterium]|nr:ribosomal RNA small subunit methyltransferase A [Acidobacteriota bacterium]
MKAKKSLGQNFLIDHNIISRIVSSVSPKNNELILEIGPGHGALTEILIKQAGLVVAVELDDELSEELKNKFSEKNLSVVHEDILDVSIEYLISDQLNLHPELNKKIRVVANLPYYISTAILTKLIKVRHIVQDMTLMLQREVAERIANPPGSKDYGILSVIAQLYAKTRILFLVKPGSFRPIPKVDSAILHLDVYKEPIAEVVDDEMLVKILQGAFSQRRKTILNNLKSSADLINPKLSSDEISKLLNSALIDPQRRAETLSCQEFAQLTKVFYEFLVGK